MSKQALQKILLFVTVNICALVLIIVMMMPFSFPADVPKIGEKKSDILSRLGTPSSIDRPGHEDRIHGYPWYEDGRPEKLESADLPRVTGERWFYSTGFGGTLHLLIYMDGDSVSKVYLHST